MLGRHPLHEFDKYECLRAIADTYKHWTDIVDRCAIPNQSCPLCEASIKVSGHNGSDRCYSCPVMVITSHSCTRHPDYRAYSDAIRKSDEAGTDPCSRIAKIHGDLVLHGLLWLWLTVNADWNCV